LGDEVLTGVGVDLAGDADEAASRAAAVGPTTRLRSSLDSGAVAAVSTEPGDRVLRVLAGVVAFPAS
jgi:hypothetical protein